MGFYSYGLCHKLYSAIADSQSEPATQFAGEIKDGMGKGK